MPRIDNHKFYTSAIKMYGLSAKGVNWSSKKSQETRFDMLLQMLPQDLSDIGIVDAGCGFGDFYTYLQRLKKIPKNYIGIDSLTDMCSISSNETGCEILQADICKDNLPISDYYICSGAMNTLELFETYLFIQNCYRSSAIAFIFNILHGEQQSPTYNYLTTQQIKKIADELKVNKIELLDGYMQNDITVGFFR